MPRPKCRDVLYFTGKVGRYVANDVGHRRKVGRYVANDVGHRGKVGRYVANDVGHRGKVGRLLKMMWGTECA